MATQVQWRGGTTDEHTTFTGANREITINTDKHTVVVHDGQTQGGFALAREDLSNVSTVSLLDRLSLSEADIADFLSDCKERVAEKISALAAKGKHIDVFALQPVGSVLAYAGQLPPEGFLMLDGQTIGANGSDADFADDKYKTLFTLLWENLDAESMVITDGKGDSSDADWQALKTIALPDGRGRSVIGFGQGEQLTNRTLGGVGGEEVHQLTVAEMPSHSHSMNLVAQLHNQIGSTLYPLQYLGYEANYMHSNTNKTGGDAPHNNMPPWLALNWVIKY